jgi:hypothetical protein
MTCFRAVCQYTYLEGLKPIFTAKQGEELADYARRFDYSFY